MKEHGSRKEIPIVLREYFEDKHPGSASRVEQICKLHQDERICRGVEKTRGRRAPSPEGPVDSSRNECAERE